MVKCVWQLSNPKAEKFDHQELKDAMLKTIAQLNEWAEEANITEVIEWIWMDGNGM